MNARASISEAASKVSVCITIEIMKQLALVPKAVDECELASEATSSCGDGKRSEWHSV